jgi:predicted small lipoprotein YifL
MINTFGILGALRLPTRALVVAALMGAGLMVVGCGQKGPLYLPTNTGAHVKHAKPAVDDSVEVKGQPAR